MKWLFRWHAIFAIVAIFTAHSGDVMAERLFSARTESAAWDNNRHVAGNCFIEQNGFLHMLYYAATQSGITAVGLARESDGNGFSRVIDRPVLEPGKGDEWDAGGVSVFPGCIIKRKDGTYWLYCSGIEKGAADFYWARRSGIGLAFSKDLVNWEKYSGNPILLPEKKYSWESEGIFEPSIIFTGDEYGGEGSFRMYYGGNDSSGRMSIGYAESFNGVNSWKKYSGNPVLAHSDDHAFDSYTVEVHHAIKLSGQYLILYEGTDRKFPSRFSIGLACSSDGVNFTRSGHVIHEGGITGSWDAMGAYHPSLVWKNGEYFLYYVGLDYRYEHAVGVIKLKSNPVEFCR